MWGNSGTSGCYTSYNPLFARDIFKSFSLKEIISDDFLNDLYPIANKYAGFSIISYFITTVNTSTFKPTEEESKYLFNKYFNIICSKVKTDDIQYNLEIIIKTLKDIAMNKKSEGEIIEFLFSENFFKNIKCSKDTISKYINKMISSGTIADMDNFISMVKEQIPDYASFPLIILNPNVSQENKIKAIKLTYKQKDFSQYKKLFRENIQDFNDIDIFIKATIFENNRVREKEDNLIKFFKDIFVSGEYRFRLNDMKNIKEFFENYKIYFTNKDFIHKFYIQSVESMQKMQYERRDQYENFIKMIFSKVDDLSLINYVAEIPELKCLGDSFSSRFLNCFLSKQYELCKEYLKVFAAWSKEERNYLYSHFKNNNEYIEILKTFANDINLQKCLNELRLISEKPKSGSYNNSYTLYEPASYYYNENAKLILFDTFKACVDIPELLSYFEAIKPGTENCFGLEYNDTCNKLKNGYSSRATLYSMVSCTRDFYSYLEEFTLKSNDNKFLQIIYNKYIKSFENEDNVQVLTTSIMSFNGNEQTKYYETYNSSNTNKPLIATEFLELINNICNIARKVYGALNKTEVYEVFKTNINDCRETLNIVCSM